MKTIITMIAVAALSISTAFAQSSNNDPQASINNYKHANKASKAKEVDARQQLKAEKVALRSQKSNKVVTSNQAVAPSNTTVTTNAQGQKSKANYKSQF